MPESPSSNLNQPAPRAVGRPRRFDDDSERRLILDAALIVLANNGYIDASINDVLVGAGVSTRSLYRHFPTKDDLMLALYVRDAEAVAKTLRRAVDSVAHPAAAIAGWVDVFLDLFYEPRKVARVAVFSSPGIRSAAGYDEVASRTFEMLIAPLIDALRTGHESGGIDSPAPERDARSIFGLISSVSEYLGGKRLEDRAAARAQVLRFCGPALGLEQLA